MRKLLLSLIVALSPSLAAAQYAGSLEFQLGFANAYENEPDEGEKTDGDLGTTLAIIPAIDRGLGQSGTVSIGAEYMFVWFKADDSDADRQLVMSPHLRTRMSFPIVDKVTFDGMLGIGPTIWTSTKNEDGTETDTRFGWSLRFAFGGSYALNSAVSAFADLGYYTTTTFGDDMTVKMSTVPLGIGLRGQF